MENRKNLKMRYSFKDLSTLMDVSYKTFRREVSSNELLMQRIKCMGWQHYKRFKKEHVLEIFKTMGFPDGYEWYERQ